MQENEVAQVLTQGEDHFSTGNMEKAKECFLKIRDLDPDHVEALNNLGVVAFQEKRLDVAISHFQKVARLDKKHMYAAFNMGRCFQAREEFEKAIEWFQKAVSLNGDHFEILNYLGDCLVRVKDFVKARDTYLSSLEINGDQQNVKSVLRKLEGLIPSQKETGANAAPHEGLEQVRIRVLSPSDFDQDPSRRKLWGDHWVKYELEREFKRLGLTVVNGQADVILYLFGVPIGDLPDNTYNMVWLYSHTDLVTPENLKQFDKIFCLSPSYVPKLNAMGYDNVEQMIGATSKKPIDVPKKYDIVFVGNPRGTKGRKIISDMGEVPYNLKVWGNGWEKILPERYIGGRYFDNQRLGELYASSLISINDHHPDMAKDGLVAVKIFDILASGGFAIADKNAGIAEIFGDAVPQYESPQHLRELLDFYIAHPEERLKLMEKGRKIALSHTYGKRAEQFAKGLKQVIEAKRKEKHSVPVARTTKTAGILEGKRPKVLYVDTISASHEACNVNGMVKAYKKVSRLETFDYRELTSRYGATQMNQMLVQKALRFKPDLIHLGKSESVSGRSIKEIKDRVDTYVIHFSGDFRWDPQPWLIDIGRYADCVLFENKKHLVWFKSVHESMDLIGYYLTNEEERERIAQTGRKEELARHSWDAHIANIMDRYEMHKAYKDLREYKNVTDAEIEQSGCDESTIQSYINTWNSKERKTPEQIKSFYNESDFLLYRNVYYNYHKQRKLNESIAIFVRHYCDQFKQGNIKILDYGAGSGALAKEMLDIANLQITLADIPSQTFEFIKWRFRNEPNVSFIEIDDQNCLKEQYDIIISYCVLEHIPEPMPVIQHLTDNLKSRGFLFLNFSTSLPKGRPSGHLKESIDQFPRVMEYVREKYDVLGEQWLYRKKADPSKIESDVHGIQNDTNTETDNNNVNNAIPSGPVAEPESIKRLHFDREVKKSEKLVNPTDRLPEPHNSQEINTIIQKRFHEILHYMTRGEDGKAVECAVRNFSRNKEYFRLLGLTGALNAGGDILRVFGQAFLQVGDFDTATCLLTEAKNRYTAAEDRILMNKGLCHLRNGEYDKILQMAPHVSAESEVIKEFNNLFSEATRIKNEKENYSYLHSLSNDLNYDRDKFYLLGMKPIGHDSHISIVDQNGQVVFEAEEERYVRVKHCGNRPLNSLIAGMGMNGVHPHQIKHIAFSFSAPEYEKACGQWEKFYMENGYGQNNMHMVESTRSYSHLLKEQEKYLKSLFTKAEVIHVKHHLAHCAGAFYSSPFERSAILSVDGRGEFETVMLARGVKDRIEELETLDCPHSLGTLYQTMTYWLGLGARNEGKTMGLSSYGDPNVYYRTFRDRIVDYDEGTGHFEINPEIIIPNGIFLYDHNKFNDIFGVRIKMDTRDPQPVFGHITAALQCITEEIILGLTRHLRDISGEKYLCMTGGVALNSVANGRVLKSNIFEDVSMHPAAHDGGTGLGAALYVYYNHVENHRPREKSWWQMRHPYLGDDFPEEDIRTAIKAAGFPIERLENGPRFAAEKLAGGKIVGWYQGRMEVGPRALGNRSILGDPRDPVMKDKINKRVKFREKWRPFAPSVLKEDCGIYFDSDHESPYMLFVYNTKKEMLDRIPAICHVDGTARVQTVDRNVNPRYYALIEEFKKITGIGLVLNTSLNIRGEPIVCTPKEAVDCFLRGGMDYMVIGDYVLDKGDLPGSAILSEYKGESISLNIPTRTGRINGFINIDVPSSKTFDDIRCDPSKLVSFATNSVDFIHSHYYLHTLSEDRIAAVLEEWRRVLKEGGRLIVEVPEFDHVFTREEEQALVTRAALENPAVFRHREITVTPFTIRILETVLSRFGFSDIRRMEVSPFHPGESGLITVSCKKKSGKES